MTENTTTAAILKVSGIILVLPFAAAATVICLPFLPLLCGGTEEQVADGIVPRSHRYDFNFDAYERAAK